MWWFSVGVEESFIEEKEFVVDFEDRIKFRKYQDNRRWGILQFISGFLRVSHGVMCRLSFKLSYIFLEDRHVPVNSY